MVVKVHKPVFGDRVTIDVQERRIDADFAPDSRGAWTPRDERAPCGVLGKYARLVTSASEGATTCPLPQLRDAGPAPRAHSLAGG